MRTSSKSIYSNIDLDLLVSNLTSTDWLLHHLSIARLRLLGLHGGVGVVRIDRCGHVDLLLWNCLVLWLASNHIHLTVLSYVLLLPWLHVDDVLWSTWIHTRGCDHVLAVIVLRLSLHVHLLNLLHPSAPDVLDNAANCDHYGDDANDRQQDVQEDDCGPCYSIVVAVVVVIVELVDEFISLSNGRAIERVFCLLGINLLQSC